MPTTSVAVPNPETARTSVSTETTGTLAKQVDTRGLCRPEMTNPSKARYQVNSEADPWFPPIETGGRAVILAREACKGCPVKAECLELALRQEQHHGDVWGIRGGLAAGERRQIIRSRRLVASVQAANQGAAR
ncbi:WhiB family transcriptional regulator [Polymorphospora sp. NPDC050346]|uniref:WhiB family transcriptional regulator n=1 Tax=Polymorphospora sp. NPDC050346 TaxID=3155780 RepID=UPI0033D10074